MSFIFDKIKESFHNKMPFVCYCKPNSEKIIAFFQKNDELFELKNNERGFAFVSFDHEKRYIIPEKFSDIYFENSSILDYIIEDNIKSDYKLKDKIEFEKLVENGIKAIKNGSLEKVVLSRKESIEIEDIDLELVYRKLLFKYETAFKYCFYHPKIGLWVGASPEQFMKIEDTLIKTVALAGTQSSTDHKKVIWENKEIEEQKIVADFIINNLKTISNRVTFSKPYNEKAGNLIHIKTDIQAEIIERESLSKIIELLHPTPAVCGFPKDAAKQFILKNEEYDREFYTGYLGEWNKDFKTFKENYSDLFVNIRCMKIENKQVTIFVGCGITKESNPESEFFETLNKLQTMKKAIQ